MNRVIVILPTRAGVLEHLRRLVAESPPFAPGPGLERRYALVTEGEVIFFLEGTEASLERALADLKGVAADAPWRGFVAGSPRVAEAVYSWAKAEDDEGLSFEPTPGPGDSDGGDVYPP